MTPVILKSIGARAYGVWAIVFALSESAWLFDFGIRSATAHFAARAHASNDFNALDRIISTSVVFFSVAGFLLVVAAALILRFSAQWFQIPAGFDGIFRMLLILAIGGWVCTAVFVAFEACLEGMARFDLLTHISVAAGLMRSVGTIAVISLGFGLIAMGIVSVAVQVSASVLAFAVVRRLIPQLRFSLAGVRYIVFRQLLAYGGPALVVSLANRLIINCGPLVIGHYLATEQVAYFVVPLRMTQLVMEPALRIGTVVRYRIAALGVLGREKNAAIVGLVASANRYSTFLLVLGAVVLIPFARPILGLWATPDIALRGAPILQILMAGAVLGMGSQFASGAALFGLGAHRTYAVAVAVQAAGGLLLMALVLPNFGILGVAASFSGMMILIRGLITSKLFCVELGAQWKPFMQATYAGPLALCVPAVIAGEFIRHLAGPVPPPLVLAASVVGVGALYAIAVVAIGLRPDERMIARSWFNGITRRG